MSVAETLWHAYQDLAEASLESPFVQGIRDGSLPRKAFAYYVGQDAFFLEAFARSYSIAAAKAPDWQSFGVFHQLAAGVLQELHLHQEYGARWGVDLQTVVPGVATRRYTDFLLAIAWGQDIGLITAAMLPCMRLYAFLGQQLAKPTIPKHDYSEWIETYSGPMFAPLVTELARLAERYTPLTPVVYATYRYAMECERDFFQAAWEQG
jgi:thiaminase/transcriptional activator TenA